MTRRALVTRLVGVMLGGLGLTAQANVISLDPTTITTGPGMQFAVDVHASFEEATVGGAFDLFYDATTLEFVSFTFDDDFFNNVADPAFAHFPDHCFVDGAPFGGCEVGDGELNAIGFGSFDGIVGDYLVGTFIFEALAPGTSALTMAVNDAPFEGFFSAETGLEMFLTYNGAEVVVTPIPAAVWLFGAALGLLATRRRLLP
jgi:hypothetical protein